MEQEQSLPVIEEIRSFLSSFGISQAQIFNQWTVIQIGILLFAMFTARVITAKLESPVNKWLSKIKNQRGLLRFLIILHRRIFWAFVSAQLWLAYVVLRSVTWPSHSYLLSILASLTITWFIISVVSRLVRNRFISRIIATIAWLVAALYILGILPRVREILDSAALNLGKMRISALSIIESVVLLTLLVWFATMASQFLGNVIARNEDISPSIKVLLTKILRFGLLALAILISLSMVGIDFTALAVFSGALGIGVGLGLQKIVSNFISGIILLIDKSIKPGDVIEIETVSDSTYGWVQHLGARYTSVRTRDGTETLIPNETFIDSPVTNWTHTNKSVRRKLPIGVSYDTDVDKAIELCLDAAANTDRVLKVPKPICIVKGFGDSSVDLELRFWINDPESGVSNVSSNAYLAVWRRFKEHGIEIPFPQRDLHVKSSIPIEVKTNSDP
ncbi:MAG: mechanosensitive ion channel domain-containing protein [Pseudomonadota bacterium]